MRRASKSWTRALLAGALALAAAQPVGARKGKAPADLSEVLSQMNEAAKRLKTVSANLEYTKVTVLVNDKSTETGQIFYHKSKNPEIRIDFQKPDRKVILFKKNKAEIYFPKINQIQEYDLEQKSELMQQFLLLGFGQETGELKKSYRVRFLKEEDLEGDTTALLELLPRKESIAAQLVKVQIWISEESWLPVQQKFFESDGDYLIARYTGVRVNRALPGSSFDLKAAPDAKRVKMN
jgi:outer membrane lipoprotein-sorting protein